MIKVLILGDGDAGTLMANKLRFHTEMKDVEITVIGDSTKHYFKPDGVHISFNMVDYKKSVKPTDYLFNYGINYINDKITKIHIEDKFVLLSSGKSVNYDYLIIATGNMLMPNEIPGYDGEARHFYDLQHSLELQEDLKAFKGGKVVIGQARNPIMCPPAPFEFAFLLEEYLNFKGLKEKSELHFISLLDRAFVIPSISDFVAERMKERNISIHTSFTTDSIDQKNKVIKSKEGENLNYDLLVLIPPHKGQSVITNSGLAGDSGYIDVDKNKLTYKDYDNVFAIGDATALPVSKAGATAHFEAGYLANRIAAETSGNLYNEIYDGSVACTSLTGYERGITLNFTYNSPPKAKFDSKFDYLLKWQSADTFFSIMARGI